MKTTTLASQIGSLVEHTQTPKKEWILYHYQIHTLTPKKMDPVSWSHHKVSVETHLVRFPKFKVEWRAPDCCLACFEQSSWLYRVCTCCSFFGVSDVDTILKIRTYCTTFIDDLSLNEFLISSYKYVVLRHDVATILIYTGSITLSVNTVCAPSEFCGTTDFSATESLCTPTFSRSLHTSRQSQG